MSQHEGLRTLSRWQLKSFKEGKSRKITVVSIHRYIASRLVRRTVTPASLPSPIVFGIRSRTSIEVTVP